MGFIDDFEKNRLELVEVIDKLDEIISSKDESDENSERLEVVNKYVRRLLNAAVPYLMPNDAISRLRSSYAQLISAYQTNNLPQIGVSIGQVVVAANVIPTKNMADFSEVTEESLVALIASYKRSKERLIVNIEKKHAEVVDKETALQQQLQALEAQIKRVEGQNNTTITALQKQFSDSQQQQRAEHNANIKADKDEVSKVIKQYDSRYETLVAKYTEHMSKFKTEEDLHKKELKDSYTSISAALQKEADALLEDLRTTEKESRDILGVVTGNAHAGHYTKYANAAEEKSKKLFVWGIVAAVAAVIVIVGPTMWDFYHNKQENIDYTYFVYRVLSSAVLLLPAIYLLHEAAKQRDVAFKYRDFEVRISASDPYLSKLTDAERDRIKAELAKAFFVAQTEAGENDNNIVIPKNSSNFILDLVGKLLKLR